MQFPHRLPIGSSISSGSSGFPGLPKCPRHPFPPIFSEYPSSFSFFFIIFFSFFLFLFFFGLFLLCPLVATTRCVHCFSTFSNIFFTGSADYSCATGVNGIQQLTGDRTGDRQYWLGCCAIYLIHHLLRHRKPKKYTIKQRNRNNKSRRIVSPPFISPAVTMCVTR